MLGRGRTDIQYQMSKELAIHILNFIKNNNMSFQEFSKKVNVDEYMLYKIISRKIKMHCYLSLLEKLAVYTQANAMQLGIRQPTICRNNYD